MKPFNLLIVLVFFMVSVMVASGCSDSGSGQTTPDGDRDALDSDEDADGDGEQAADGDRETDPDAEPDGDAETETETEWEAWCDDPWPMPDTPFQPTRVHVDAPYRQHVTRLVESGAGEPAPRALSTPLDGACLAATPTGLASLTADGALTDYADWELRNCIDVARLPEGQAALLCSDRLYLGAPDAEPQSLALPAAGRMLALGEALFVLGETGEVYRIDTASPAVTDTFSFDAGDTPQYLFALGAQALFFTAESGLWRLSLNARLSPEKLVSSQDLPGEAHGVSCTSLSDCWLGTSAGLVHWQEGQALDTLTGEDGLPILDLGFLHHSGGELLIGSTIKRMEDPANPGSEILSGHGLVVYDSDAERWSYYQSRYYMPDDVVWDAERDADHLYIAGSTGFSVVSFSEMTLAQKAAVMDLGQWQRHNRDGMFSGCRLSEAGDLSTAVTHDDDNDGQWTEMYLASQAFRYAVTGSEEARLYAKTAADAMLRLLTVTGLPGFFARSVVRPEGAEKSCPTHGEWHLSADEQWCWKGDTSGDEYVGHIFGLSLYYDLVADESERATIRDVFVDLHDGIIAHGYQLIDVDGEPTSHGFFDPEFMEGIIGQFGDAGLYSAMFLGGLAATYHMSGETRFMDVFRELALDHDYADYVRRIEEINTAYLLNHDSEEMSFLALFTLIRYEKDPCFMALWQEGLDLLWETNRPERNPEFTFLTAMMTGRDDPAFADAVATLKAYHMNGVRWTVNNSHRADYEKNPKNDRFGREQSLAVYPFEQKHFMRWSNNPYRLDYEADGHYEEMLQVWLLPYWLGRYMGAIVEE